MSRLSDAPRRLTSVAAVIAALLLTSSCSSGETAPAAGPTEISGGVAVPEQVDIAEWDHAAGNGVMTVTPSEGFSTLRSLVDSSSLIVVGKVAEQHPFPDVDLVATESLIEVSQLLKGSRDGAPVRVYTLGTPIYAPRHTDIDGAGDPPLFDHEYVFFLAALPELTRADGVLMPLTVSTWRSLGFGQFVRGDGGLFRWDGDGDAPGGPVSLEGIVEAVNVG